MSASACAMGAQAPWWRRSRRVAEPEVSLDKALERLEAIADKLEDPGLDLDDAVRLYEEGLRLYADCAKRLDAADLRITQLADALAKQARERGAG
ncbi:MAG: exodeoxyribonuclease VII small subunit [Chloroflexi bacterium]|nr:MAG: exodeoxyribonuclease VII small subunit [Chloroflexota bacterium]